MKKLMVLTIWCMGCVGVSAFVGIDPVAIAPHPQRVGDAAKGYDYILSAQYIQSGLPYDLYRSGFGNRNTGYLPGHEGLGYDFSLTKSYTGSTIVAPNCFQCHAEILNDQLIIGLGNTTKDFTAKQLYNVRPMQDLMIGYLKWLRPAEYKAAYPFTRATRQIDRQVFTQTRGINGADRLFSLLVAHRDTATLTWSDSMLVPLADVMIPSDVPAWWLMKKKNAMFYSGEGRGDFGKFIQTSSLLTLIDSADAARIDKRMPDVLAYILSVKSPLYPGKIDTALAARGKGIFQSTCAGCHGSYADAGGGHDAPAGSEAYERVRESSGDRYPNLLIPQQLIGTDPWLSRSNFLDPAITGWYNASWFSRGVNPSWIQPFDGYLAPPLDGIWATAPYLHNGSIPELAMVLDSGSRPMFWRRRFSKKYYDIDRMGVKYERRSRPGGKLVYDASLPGYGNQGHQFGDALSSSEREAVVEYLKTI